MQYMGTNEMAEVEWNYLEGVRSHSILPAQNNNEVASNASSTQPGNGQAERELVTFSFDTMILHFPDGRLCDLVRRPLAASFPH